MSITNKRREALIDYLVKELGVHNVRDFSESLRILGICDLLSDEDLVIVTENGLIDTFVVLYRFGTISKLIEAKYTIQNSRK